MCLPAPGLERLRPHPLDCLFLVELPILCNFCDELELAVGDPVRSSTPAGGPLINPQRIDLSDEKLWRVTHP